MKGAQNLSVLFLKLSCESKTTSKCSLKRSSLAVLLSQHRMGEEGEIGDHLGGYCLIQVRGDGGWHQGGARVIELLSVPSGPCNRATFRSARRPACHYLSPSLLSSLDLVCCPLLMPLSAIVAAI